MTLKKHPPLPKFGLAIDFETSGYTLPNYASKHQGISFGVIIFDIKTFEEIDYLYCEVKFNDLKYEWNAGAEQVHGLSREYLSVHGMDMEDAALALGELILKYFGDTEIVLLGHRVQFDEAFLNQLMASIDVELKYHSIRLDSAALSLALLYMTHSDHIFDALGFEERKDHNSFEDIQMTLAAIRKYKEKFTSLVFHP
jgi:oligoribonuclease (3'-5' exoribonuclease)